MQLLKWRLGGLMLILVSIWVPFIDGDITTTVCLMPLGLGLLFGEAV